MDISRKHFIKKCGISAFAIAASSIFPFVSNEKQSDLAYELNDPFFQTTKLLREYWIHVGKNIKMNIGGNIGGSLAPKDNPDYIYFITEDKSNNGTFFDALRYFKNHIEYNKWVLSDEQEIDQVREKIESGDLFGINMVHDKFETPFCGAYGFLEKLSGPYFRSSNKIERISFDDFVYQIRGGHYLDSICLENSNKGMNHQFIDENQHKEYHHWCYNDMSEEIFYKANTLAKNISTIVNKNLIEQIELSKTS